MPELKIEGALVPAFYDLRDSLRAYGDKHPEGVTDPRAAYAQVRDALDRAGFAIRAGDVNVARETMLEVAALALAYSYEVRPTPRPQEATP